MECSICLAKMLGSSESIFTTICGHLYHEECLVKTLRAQPNCPQCRKPITQANIHQVFFELDQSQDQVILTRLSEVSIALAKQDSKFSQFSNNMTDALEKITLQLSAFEFQTEEMRKDNLELNDRFKALDINPNAPTVQQADAGQLKQKDEIIENLQKEISVLKQQRSDTTREMYEIRQQIDKMKATAKGNKRVLKEANEQKPPQSLTLKFDDINDKLIIE